VTHVGDANSIFFGLISDSMTRRLLIELEHYLLTPTDVHDKITSSFSVVDPDDACSTARALEPYAPD
jgi:hypothetical protein